jgi:hypothetical protein
MPLWDIDSRFNKYKKVSKDDLLRTVGTNYNKLVHNAKNIQPKVNMLKANLLPPDLKEMNVGDKVAAIAIEACPPESNVDPIKASNAIKEIMLNAIDIGTSPKYRNKNDRDKCQILMAKVDEIVHRHTLTPDQGNAIIKMIWDDDGGFSGALENISKWWNEHNAKKPGGGPV